MVGQAKRIPRLRSVVAGLLFSASVLSGPASARAQLADAKEAEALCKAAEKGDLAQMERLLAAGTDVNGLGGGQLTPLMRAELSKNLAAVKFLLERKADPNLITPYKMFPLMLARDAETADELIRHGAKIKDLAEPLLPRMVQLGSAPAIEAVILAGGDHDTAVLNQTLLAAAHMNRDEAARVAIKYGAQVNEPVLWAKDDKVLPLMACCIFGSAKVARVLLENGADPNAGAIPGLFLKNAMQNRYPELAQLLRAAGAKGASDLSFALATGDSAKVHELLATAPDFQSNPAFWEGVMTNAALHGDTATVQAALDKGVPVIANQTDEDDYVAAATEGQHEVLAILLAHRGKKPDGEDLRQALWEAVWNAKPYKNQRPPEAFEKTIQLLIDAGAPVNSPDTEHDLMIAAIFTRNPGGSARAIQLLAKAGANPNPMIKERSLAEAVKQACQENTCSTPSTETLAAFNQIAKPAPKP